MIGSQILISNKNTGKLWVFGLKCSMVIKINILNQVIKKILLGKTTGSIRITINLIKIIKISSIGNNGNSHITTPIINRTLKAIISKINIPKNINLLLTFLSNNKIMVKFSVAMLMLLIIIIHTTAT